MKKILFLLSLPVILQTVKAQNYFVSTVAGNGTQGLVDGPRVTTAELNWPYGLAYDGDSVVYFSDGANHCIRKISTVTNLVTTIAGSSTSGLQDGIGTAAKFNFPDDLFFRNGILYVGDNMNNCIRKIDIATYSVTTIAGTGVAGYLDGPVNQAMFHGGNGIALAVANNGDIYVADGTNAVIRKISGGQVTTIAGTPGVFGYVDGTASSSKFHRPRYIVLDTTNGDLFITDINNNVIRKLSGGVVSTFSGTGVAGGLDGPANTATFSAPVGITRTYNGYFYVVDGGGNKLRKIDPTGTVTTIAGNGNFGFVDGPAASAEFYYPQDVCYDKHCYIYMADRNNNRIRRIIVPEGPAGCTNGINELTPYLFDVNIYPNPSQGILNIEMPASIARTSFHLTNVMGQLVKSGELQNGQTQTNLSDLDNGIYFIEITEKGKTINKKIVLQK
ncbi:MAG TPA: T9SS type A sorting domain-containing protein [Bacteroidia bacterium]|jgi:hypothetical protein|nr:T9SS type A sorting domain-containing protein [Bacteroidia bacterium]